MNKNVKRIVPFVLVLLILLSIAWYLLVYDRDFTRDILISQARYHDTQGSSRLASWFYDLAYRHTGQDDDVAIELAEQYRNDENYTKAEYTLTNAIAEAPTAELYIALSKTFVEQDKLLDAVRLLDEIQNSQMKATMDALRPSAPVPDWTPGLYSQYLNVNITAEGTAIYCSQDGEYPSTASDLYTESVSLPGGETVLYAVAVAENGLVSPLSIMNYTVGSVIEEAVFTDSAMENHIRQLLQVDAEHILMTDELWSIAELTIPADAASIEDVKLFPYLQTLTIDSKKIDSLSCLAGLTELKNLQITNCHIPAESLSVLANLPSLEQLTLSNCGLSTIEGLEGAHKLTDLDLSNNTLRNLEVLSDISTLREIDLSHNAVTDLTALRTLHNLEFLDVSYNAVTSLVPLAGCPVLNRLDASHNSLSSLEDLDSFTALQYLAVDYNQLTDISVLAACTALTELSISNNSIKDIRSLSTLTALENFNFSYNQVSQLPDWPRDCALITIDGSHNELLSLVNLQYMEHLCYVYMDYNQLTNIDPLANCYRLVAVNVYGNSISDVSALTARNIIVNYDPT